MPKLLRASDPLPSLPRWEDGLQLAAHYPRPLLFRNRMLSLADPVFLPWDFRLLLFTPSVVFSSTTPGSPRTFSLLAYPHGFQLATPPLGLLLLCLAWTFPLHSSLQCVLHTPPTQESRVVSPLPSHGCFCEGFLRTSLSRCLHLPPGSSPQTRQALTRPLCSTLYTLCSF